MGDDKYDYLVVGDDMYEIVSRWFIIEKTRTRGGQYQFQLLRDVLADYYDYYASAPMYVERAFAATNTPYIYNKENFAVNQIKTSETLLKDKTGCPWIVGYLAQNSTSKPYTTPTPEGASTAIQLGSTLEEWEYYKYITTLNGTTTSNKKLHASPTSYVWRMNDARRGLQGYDIFIDGANGELSYDKVAWKNDTPVLNGTLPTQQSKISAAFRNAGLSQLIDDAWAGDYITDFLTDSEYTSLMELRNARVLTSDGKIYQLSITSAKSIFPEVYNIPRGSALNTKINNIYKNSGAFATYINGWPQYLQVHGRIILIAVEEVAEAEASFTIPENKRRTIDSQFDIFCMPYGEVSIYNENGELVVEKTNKDMAMMAYSVIQEKEQTFLYDIQLVPFCPVQEFIQEDGSLRYTKSNQFAPIASKVDNTVFSGLFFVSRASFSFNIPLTIELPRSTIERKIVNQCDKYRLCSPNYSTYFDFNLNQNGTINFFEVDCTYKPYSPYIHVCPEFGGLYGGDFNDPRGLILGGDFSLTQIENKWQTYQINNKNYNEIFRAGIENLEVQQDIARRQEPWMALAGSLQGGASGALAGSYGGLWGMAIGGLVGSGSSAAAGLADIGMNEELRQQQLLYTNQLHDYSLQNIQALPHTLSKVDSLTPNNKIFPVLEYYTCTPKEKMAFVNMLKYEGMTIGAIGTFEDFIGFGWEYDYHGEGEDIIKDSGFIRGQLIQLPNFYDDSHIAYQIAKELKQGVYTK